MTPNSFTDALFQLVLSLEKSEKRHFKLYINRSSASKEELRITQLFDALDKMPEYDEKLLLKKLSPITKPQLANLKTHLYRQLLASLRLLKTAENIDLQLSEQLDYARLLYNKGLKLQALKILDKAKELAKENHKFNFLAQVISLEKKIETLHITRSSQEKVELLAEESREITGHIDRVSRLSSLALQLYRWYIKNGHARNQTDEKEVRDFFYKHLPSDTKAITDFYELMYLYQSYCWFGFIRFDFIQYYRYSQRWVALFHNKEVMISVEPGHYIKGMHNLLNAHFDLRNFKEFDITLKQFEDYSKTQVANLHDNFRVHTFIYINSAKINRHLMQGTFAQGLELVKQIEGPMMENSPYIDMHRIMVFNYKIATLYFGNEEYSKAIDYLQRIMYNGNADLRIDLQCYARLLHLMSHYELGNYDIMESLTKSVYRFMARMKYLTVVEEEMFRFIRRSFGLSPRDLKPEFEKLLEKIKHLEGNRFETRSFAYLDVISWVESKVFAKPLSQIIRAKYLASKHLPAGVK